MSEFSIVLFCGIHILIDRPAGGERAILVQVALPGIDAEEALAEFADLAFAAGAEVLGAVLSTSTKHTAKYYVGLGKVDEIREQVLAHKAELVLFNHELSPSLECRPLCFHQDVSTAILFGLKETCILCFRGYLEHTEDKLLSFLSPL